MITLQVSEAEFHTLLAALRFYQAGGQGEPANRPAPIHDLASNGNMILSLDDDGIDRLCQRINIKSTAVPYSCHLYGPHAEAAHRSQRPH